MVTEKDLESRYKTYSNLQLLEILESPANYQAIAVKVAKNEWLSRNLSAEEVGKTKYQLENKILVKIKKKESDDLLIAKVNSVGQNIYETINPINESSPKTSKIVGFISLVYFIFFFRSLALEVSSFSFFLNEEAYFELIMSFLPIVVLGIAVTLFLLRRKDGWRLLVFYCSLALTGEFYGVYQYTDSFFNEESYYFFGPPSIPGLLLNLTLYIGTILTLSRRGILETFNVKIRERNNYTLMGLVVGILYCLAYMA